MVCPAVHREKTWLNRWSRDRRAAGSTESETSVSVSGELEFKSLRGGVAVLSKAKFRAGCVLRCAAGGSACRPRMSIV